MNPRDLPDDDEPGFFRRNLVVVVIGLLMLGGGAWAYVEKPRVVAKPKLDAPIVIVRVNELEPELPKPKPEIKQTPEQKNEDKILPAEIEPQEPVVEKMREPVVDTPMTTAIAGAEGSGLHFGTQGGAMIGRTGGIGGAGYSERSVWQRRFSRKLEELLGKVPELKTARGTLPFLVWLDDTGRITRINLTGSIGNSKNDQAFESRMLIGQVIEPAPAGTPMPVHIRFSAR